jgi:hypothetical protein
MLSIFKSKSQKTASVVEPQDPHADQTQDLIFFTLQKLKHVALMNEELEGKRKHGFERGVGECHGRAVEDLVHKVTELADFLFQKNEKNEAKIEALKQRLALLEAEVAEGRRVGSVGDANQEGESISYAQLQNKVMALMSQIREKSRRILAGEEGRVVDRDLETLTLQNQQLISRLAELESDYALETFGLKKKLEASERAVQELTLENQRLRKSLKRFGFSEHPTKIGSEALSSKLVGESKLRQVLLSFLDCGSFMIFSHASKYIRFQTMVMSPFANALLSTFVSNPAYLSSFYGQPELEATKVALQTEIRDKDSLRIQIKRFLQYKYSPVRLVALEIRSSLEKLERFDRKLESQKSSQGTPGSFAEKLRMNLGRLDLPGFNKQSFSATVFDQKFLEEAGRVYKEALNLSHTICLEKLATLSFDPLQATETKQDYESKQNALFGKNVEEKAGKLAEYLFDLFEDLKESGLMRGHGKQVGAAVGPGILAVRVPV